MLPLRRWMDATLRHCVPLYFSKFNCERVCREHTTLDTACSKIAATEPISVLTWRCKVLPFLATFCNFQCVQCWKYQSYEPLYFSFRFSVYGFRIRSEFKKNHTLTETDFPENYKKYFHKKTTTLKNIWNTIFFAVPK